MLRGKTLGIVGCGRIGGWMGKYGTAFGMNVIGYDPYVPAAAPHVDMVSFDTLLAAADVITVHVHLSDETRGLISRAAFRKMKRGAIFINTSRGAIADETALLDSLQSGHLGAAGLDVLDGEPDIDRHPLVQYARHNSNIIITPHCGGFSPDAVRIVCRRAAEKIVQHITVNSDPPR